MGHETRALPRQRYESETSRWQAVADRDRRADGTFLYGVVTTGVFCRPGCASRRPRRENVRFFDDAAAALRAGFRPCRRCRPEDSAPPQTALIARACARLEAEAPALADLAAEAGLSPWHFQRLFRATLGVSPKQYAASRRMGRFRTALTAEPSVTTALYAAGFGASSRAYAKAGEALGMAPGLYRRGAPGLSLRYAFGRCFLGAVVVAATDRGLCAIELGDEEGALLAGLRARFPKAELAPAEPAFAATVAAVTALLETPAAGLALPLDVQGTAFQQRVWQALREIPPGTTVTYGELAARLGRPRAARAVASACAANPLAVAIPCHRALRADGGLGGYRWEVSRKAALLAREAGASPLSRRRTGRGSGR